MKIAFCSLLLSVFVIALLSNQIPNAHAEDIVIYEDTVIDYDIMINGTDTLQINSDITLLIKSRIENNGTINNNGVIENNGWGTSSNGHIVNSGTVNNNGVINNKRGGIDNTGTINNLKEINNDWKINSNGIFNNSGTVTNNPGGDINNKKTFTNTGNVLNNCSAQVRGIPIVGNPVIEQCPPPASILPKNTTIHCKSNQFLHNGQCIDNMSCQENEESINGECVVKNDPSSSGVFWWTMFLVIPAGIIIGIIAWYKSRSNSDKSNPAKSDYFNPVEK